MQNHRDETAVAGAGLGVHLSRHAKGIFVNWHDDNAALIGASSDLAAGFCSKLPANVARLSLVLHALWRPDDPRPMVSAQTMADTIELAEFCRAHTGRFLALLQRAATVGGAGLYTRILRILGMAQQENDESWVPRTQIYRRLRTASADELTSALQDLVESGSVEVRTSPSNTKPAQEYRMRNSQNSHYSGDDEAWAGDSANSANLARSTHDEVIATMIENLLTLTAEELLQYRTELASVPADDPHIVLDRAALDRFDELLAGAAT